MNKPASPWPFPMNAPAIKLAQVTMLALSLHEGSYDQEAADLAQEDAEKRLKAMSESDRKFGYWGVNYSKFYRKDLRTCCWVAATEHSSIDLAMPVYLLLTYASNDIIEWAQELTGEKFAVTAYDAALYIGVPEEWMSIQDLALRGPTTPPSENLTV